MGILKKRFLERNYKESLLNKAIEETSNTDKKDRKEITKEEGIAVPFITGYSREGLQMKKIIQKNWHILKSDPIIGSKISSKPQIIFRRAPNIKDHIISSYIKPKKRKNLSFQEWILQLWPM